MPAAAEDFEFIAKRLKEIEGDDTHPPKDDRPSWCAGPEGAVCIYPECCCTKSRT